MLWLGSWMANPTHRLTTTTHGGCLKRLASSQQSFPISCKMMKKLHTVARHEATVAEEQAQRVQQQIVKRRRAKILPSADELRKIGRYESHLSKEMYRALHELEALQERRIGGRSPLARLDVQLP